MPIPTVTLKDDRPYWQVCADELERIADAEAGLHATPAERRAALQRAHRQRPDLSVPYSQKQLDKTEANGITRRTVRGLEIETEDRRAAGDRLAEYERDLVKSGQAATPREARQIARRDLPEAARIYDGRSP